MLTFPLAFPGGGRRFHGDPAGRPAGLDRQRDEWLFGEKLVFAYSMAGLFLGYLYFSIPRCDSHHHGGGGKTRPGALEEAARSLGASPVAGGARCDHAGPQARR